MRIVFHLRPSAVVIPPKTPSFPLVVMRPLLYLKVYPSSSTVSSRSAVSASWPPETLTFGAL